MRPKDWETMDNNVIHPDLNLAKKSQPWMGLGKPSQALPGSHSRQGPLCPADLVLSTGSYLLSVLWAGSRH